MGPQLFHAETIKEEEQINPDRVDPHLDSSGVVEIKNTLPGQILVEHRPRQLERSSHHWAQLSRAETIKEEEQISRDRVDSHLESSGVVEVEHALPCSVLVEH
jgi:DNA-binding sugar fermentation-stimulating protein